MSIKPFQGKELTGIEALRERSAPSGRMGRGGFAEVLAEVAGRRGSQPPTGAEAAALARLASLEMLRSTMSLGNEEEAPSLPSPLRLWELSPPDLKGMGQAPGPSPAPPSPFSAALPERVAPPAEARPRADIDDLVSRAAERFEVDPALVKAVIRAESGFDPTAVSRAGARGLMQLMPGTARELGVADSFDPEQNVMGGTSYLKKMLDKYGGDLDSALAAYNWGPGNFDRRSGELPRETRDYQVKVKRFLEDYRA